MQHYTVLTGHLMLRMELNIDETVAALTICSSCSSGQKCQTQDSDVKRIPVQYLTSLLSQCIN